MYMGYNISCYNDDGYFYTIPINHIESYLKEFLKKDFLIDGEPLTEDQFKYIQNYIVEGAEITWNKNFKYYIEGKDLPEPS